MVIVALGTIRLHVTRSPFAGRIGYGIDTQGFIITPDVNFGSIA
jgi:hypothetical protein